LISAAALSIKHVRKKLNTLPTTLAATYDEAIRRITNQDPDHKDIAFKTLAWVSYTFRPLRLKELQHALAIEPGVEELDEEMVLDEQSITALCAGLVVIDTGTDAVNLVHYTTKSYLEDKRQVFFPGFHGQITMNCAAYLMISPLRKATIWEIVHNYPLACYAAQYMGDHARHNPEEALEQSILDAVYQLLAQRHSRKPLLCLLDGLDLIRSGFYSSNNPLLPMDNIGDEGTDDEPGKVGAEPAKGLSNQILEVTSLHLAASMGLARVAAMLLKETTDIDAMDETGKTALAVAIEKGFEKAVEFLVYSGACVDLHTDHGRGVFLLLIEKSWHAVADIVCAKAKSSAPEKAADVHLLFAAYSGKADELGRIIQRDPSVSEDAKLMELALFVAVECTRPAIIELLLSDYVDVNCKDNTGQTSLHRATRRGSESIVEILLKHGADIDSVNDEGLTAWSSNLSSKNERILGILLAAGTDPNTKGPNGVSQLYSAAASGQIEIVKLMLKSGTNPSIKTDFSWAPLHWASYNGHIECVKLLINAGADPNPVSDQETTPLDLALRANQTAVIVILLGAGGQEAIHLAENDLGSASGFDSTKSLSLLSKTASSITLAEADEAGAPAKMAFAFDQPLEQSTSFGQFIYPIHHRSGCRDVHDFSGLNNQPYQISHMLDNRAHSISVRRAKFRPLMSEYPLKEDLFVREGVLYDIAPVTMDYQDLELHGDAENAISGPITMRKSWSGSWKAHHVDKGSTKLLFRSIPDWTVTNKPGSRWVREDGYLIARIGGALETTLIVEERLDSKLLDALVACWVAKTWSETLTTHKGKWH
jgi:ankyrin repeat protein